MRCALVARRGEKAARRACVLGHRSKLRKRSAQMSNVSSEMPSPLRIEAASPSRADVEAWVGGGVPVVLLGCNFDEMDLSTLDMSDWRFEGCSLKRTKLIGAGLESAAFEKCRGAFANFAAARLTDASFRACDFNNASFTEASLSQVSFVGCKLVGIDLIRAKSTGTLFRETTLSAARLPGFSFRQARLEGVDLSLAELSKCDFREVVFENSSLREAHLVDARFEEADLRGADLGGIRLHDARKFKGATISRAQAGDLLAEMGLKVR